MVQSPAKRLAPFLIPFIFFGLAVAAGAAGDQDWFRDVAGEKGIDFVHQDGRFGDKYFIETAAGGGGFLDFDGDGDLDIYLLQGAPTPGSRLRPPSPNRLYENRGGGFFDVTRAAGVGDEGYGMGLCVGDIDADGRLDFLVTNYGPDRLYRGLGAGRFEEVAEKAGVADPRWSASCAFGDVDGDGDLDLYVVRYVDFRFDKNPFCGDRARNLRAYCRPEAFDGIDDSLYINNGKGGFVDQAEARGIATGGKNEKGFGVVLSDIDNDGDLDIYVANDGTLNRLYANQGKGTFSDQALLSGVGLSDRGVAESGMGVDIADLDGDGLLDLLVTNYSMESNTLYRNQGGMLFADRTSKAGLVEPSYPWVGWGVRLFDADNDGDRDLAVANGHAVDNIEIFEAGLSYRQKNSFFLNQGGLRFSDAGKRAGAAFQVERVSRSLAVGDFDDDGRLDLLITNTNDPIDLLHNEIGSSNHWLGLRLSGSPANPLAIGARVTLRAKGLSLLEEVRSGGSFMAQSDLRPHFGLGRAPGPVKIEIRWPDGKIQRLQTEKIDRYLAVSYAPGS